MVGLPYSGKSYYANNLPLVSSYTRISSDDEVMKFAELRGQAYNDVFDDVVTLAMVKAENRFIEAVKRSESILLDQTNLTRASRRRKLDLVPSGYTKGCIYCPPPCQLELTRRMEVRETHRVPPGVLSQMYLIYEEPKLDEGFDWLYIAGFDDIVIAK
jgi:tRNA uridine 5-carbamoylmethylation protein Kti12